MIKKEDLPKLETELSTYEGTDKIVSSHEMRDKLASEPLQARIQSMLGKMDAVTEGFQSGELIAMSGKTGCGKTSFCQTLTNNYALQGINCLWFTYEIPVREMLTKFPATGLPLFYLPEMLTDNALEWIEKRIIEAIVKNGVKVVFIDHLHYLIPMSQQQNVSILIGGVMRELKKMSIRHNVLIFIIAHTAKVKTDDKPSLDWLRDSSFVAQESDYVLLITRPDEDELESNDTRSRLHILKNRRNGRRACVEMAYNANQFKEIEAGNTIVGGAR